MTVRYQLNCCCLLSDCFDDGATAEVVNSVQDLTANYGLHHFIDTFASDAAMCDVPLQGLQHGKLLHYWPT